MNQPLSHASAAGVYMLAAVFARLQFFVTLPLVSRQVTPEEYGILTLANIVAVFIASTVQATVSGSVERFYADHEGERRVESLGTIFVYLLALAGGMLALALAAGPYVATALIESLDYPFFPYFLIPILTALVATVNTFGTSLFRIEEKPARVLAYALVRFVAAVAVVMVTVGWLDGGLLGYLLALLASELVVAVASLPYVLRRIRLTPSAADLREILAFTLPFAPYVLLALLRDTGDRWILQHYVSLEQIGVYGLGWGIASGMSMVVSSVTLPYAATMMKRFGRRTSVDAERANLDYFRPAATQAMVLTLVAYGAFLLLIEDVVRWLTPVGYHQAWKAAALLGGVFVFRALYLIPHNVLQWTRRTGVIPIVTACGLVVGLPLIALLAPVIGTPAGAVGLSVCYLVSWLACAAFLPRRAWLYPGDIGLTLAAAAICALAALAVTFMPDSVVMGVARFCAVLLGGAGLVWVHRRRHEVGGHPIAEEPA